MSSPPKDNLEAFLLSVKLMQTAPDEKSHKIAKDLLLQITSIMSAEEFEEAYRLIPPRSYNIY